MEQATATKFSGWWHLGQLPQPGPTRVVVVRVDVRLTPRRRPASAQVTQQASPAAQRVASQEARAPQHPTRCSSVTRQRIAARKEAGLAPGSVQIFSAGFRRLGLMGASCRRRTGDLAKKIVALAGPRFVVRDTAVYRGQSRCRPLRCCDTVQVPTPYGGIASQRAKCRTYWLSRKTQC
jgi:hypothetical protein